MKLKASTKYFLVISSITMLFCLAIAFNLTPFLRGPSPYPPEWRWPYFFVNTLAKIYFPIFVIGLLLLLFYFKEKNNIIVKKIWLFLLCLVLLHFFFQLGLLFFSRSGISVLVHRIINPELNGYFTASLSIQSLPDFFHQYNTNILHFIYHAKAHPPGAILIFYLIKQILLPFGFFIQFAQSLNPAHTDVGRTWATLLPIDKATALAASFIIPFLSSLSLIPLFYSAKRLYDNKIAVRTTLLFFFVPTILFFIPINDCFLQLFSITSFFFLLKGLQDKNNTSLFFSGFILFLGVFFNLSLLPVVLLFCLFFFMYLFKKGELRLLEFIKRGIAFPLGFITLPILLQLFFQFNFVEMITIILKYVPDIHSRSYSLWLYYNIYDFLVFCGIPIAIVFFIQGGDTIRCLTKKTFSKIDPLFIAFVLMIIILDFSGSVRGETGRLWSPYIPFIVMATSFFLTNTLKFTTNQFTGILLLQALQVLVMQEFWVMLW